MIILRASRHQHANNLRKRDCAIKRSAGGLGDHLRVLIASSHERKFGGKFIQSLLLVVCGYTFAQLEHVQIMSCILARSASSTLI